MDDDRATSEDRKWNEKLRRYALHSLSSVSLPSVLQGHNPCIDMKRFYSTLSYLRPIPDGYLSRLPTKKVETLFREGRTEKNLPRHEEMRVLHLGVLDAVKNHHFSTQMESPESVGALEEHLRKHIPEYQTWVVYWMMRMSIHEWWTELQRVVSKSLERHDAPPSLCGWMLDWYFLSATTGDATPVAQDDGSSSRYCVGCNVLLSSGSRASYDLSRRHARVAGTFLYEWNDTLRKWMVVFYEWSCIRGGFEEYARRTRLGFDRSIFYTHHRRAFARNFVSAEELNPMCEKKTTPKSPRTFPLAPPTLHSDTTSLRQFARKRPMPEHTARVTPPEEEEDGGDASKFPARASGLAPRRLFGGDGAADKTPPNPKDDPDAAFDASSSLVILANAVVAAGENIAKKTCIGTTF